MGHCATLYNSCAATVWAMPETAGKAEKRGWTSAVADIEGWIPTSGKIEDIEWCNAPPTFRHLLTLDEDRAAPVIPGLPEGVVGTLGYCVKQLWKLKAI